MIVDHEALMEWARAVEESDERFADELHYRPIRLEIAAERLSDMTASDGTIGYDVFARVYLRKPRCRDQYAGHDDSACECRPLAEKRLT